MIQRLTKKFQNMFLELLVNVYYFYAFKMHSEL